MGRYAPGSSDILGYLAMLEPKYNVKVENGVEIEVEMGGEWCRNAGNACWMGRLSRLQVGAAGPRRSQLVPEAAQATGQNFVAPSLS
jgi:hypothetical protein